MIHEIQAKTLLQRVRGEDKTFGLTYNLNLYRGCQHQCIYCDSRSLCYGIEDFRDVLVKVNAVTVLESELARKRLKGVIGFGSMSDPYGPVEKQYNLTSQTLAVIARYGFPVHVNTKSDMVVKDIEVLGEINRVHARVCFTLTTTDDALARKLEPGAPSPSRRLAAMQALTQAGIPCGVSLMPILPWITDTPEALTAIVEQAAGSGASFFIPWFGMSLRDRQREYFYEELDRHFPGLRKKYEQRYGERYSAPAPNAKALEKFFFDLCRKVGVSPQVPLWREAPQQPGLF